MKADSCRGVAQSPTLDGRANSMRRANQFSVCCLRPVQLIGAIIDRLCCSPHVAASMPSAVPRGGRRGDDCQAVALSGAPDRNSGDLPRIVTGPPHRYALRSGAAAPCGQSPICSYRDKSVCRLSSETVRFRATGALHAVGVSSRRSRGSGGTCAGSAGNHGAIRLAQHVSDTGIAVSCGQPGSQVVVSSLDRYPVGRDAWQPGKPNRRRTRARRRRNH
jgi:hypothetical protein